MADGVKYKCKLV